MIKFSVDSLGNGKKIVSYLQSKFNNLSSGTIYKALRNKDIRVNGTKISENITVNPGDELTIYITDDILFGNMSLTSRSIIYEDNNIIIVNKPQNMLVISEENDIGLDNLVYNYLGFPAYPCHRIDRNTSGLVIFAKNHEIEEQMFQAIRKRALRKYYKKKKFKVKEGYLFNINAEQSEKSLEFAKPFMEFFYPDYLIVAHSH